MRIGTMSVCIGGFDVCDDEGVFVVLVVLDKVLYQCVLRGVPLLLVTNPAP